MVIVVTEIPTPDIANENEARNRFLLMLTDEMTKDRSTPFSALVVLCLFPPSSISTEARLSVRMSRSKSRTFFSARYFAAFFELACDHLAMTLKEPFDGPFDFVKTSRSLNPVSPNLDEHLSNFFSMIKSPYELTKFAVPIISSFLLDPSSFFLPP